MVSEALRAPSFLATSAAPLLLQRSDGRFMQAIRRELAEPARRAALTATLVTSDRGAPSTLFQPTHRVTHLALVEAFCQRPGEPPLDAAKIESAGVVVRRVSPRGQERWVSLPDGTQGWQALAPDELDQDPDPARRKSPGSGNREIDRLLALRRAALPPGREAESPLFTLPPDVFRATGRTLLYGLVPTASLDASAAPAVAAFEREELVSDGFPAQLLASADPPPVPSAGQRLSARDLRERAAVRTYADFVQRMIIVYDLLGTSPAASALRGLLESHRLPFAGGRQRSAAVHLAEAADALVLGKTERVAGRAEPVSVEMPLSWPRVSQELESRLIEAVSSAIRARHASLAREQGRFADVNARYVVRAFARVRTHAGCPPLLIWSAPTEPVRIAAWFERGPAPLPVVPLPDPAEGLSKLAPNVAFEVPASIADLLRANTPARFLEGEASAGGGFGIRWICSFSIPIITLCAFIVLSIFLSLLNIVFWWLPFVRICLPLPRRS